MDKIGNKKLTWINFLHLYQPANADDNRIVEATEKSYARIIRALKENPRIKFTLNIMGCLFVRWQETEQEDIIKKIKALVKKGQIELTGSAAYHPLLPLIPEDEIIKQVKENENILKEYFGKNYKPSGFFLPEMAYSAKAAKIIRSLGYRWLILDEIAYNGKLGEADISKVYQDKNSNLLVVLRSRKFSSSYVPDLLKQETKKLAGVELAITATDGELYGLRHEDPTAEFEKILKNRKIITQTISEYIAENEGREIVKFRDSNWEATERELIFRRPYALWVNKGNGIQKNIWQLAELAMRTIERHEDDENYDWARWHLVRGMASCTFWWASEKDFSYIYGPYAWNPDEIERGIRELIKSIRSLEATTTRKTKIKAEKLYVKIKKMIWDKHWSVHWKK